MVPFSERCGYVKPRKALVREEINIDVQNAICSALNTRFQTLGFAYRIVNNQIVEVTSEEEIKEIENALVVIEPVAKHLSSSMALLSQ